MATLNEHDEFRDRVSATLRLAYIPESIWNRAYDHEYERR